jgi:hypothetical protein
MGDARRRKGFDPRARNAETIGCDIAEGCRVSIGKLDRHSAQSSHDYQKMGAPIAPIGGLFAPVSFSVAGRTLIGIYDVQSSYMHWLIQPQDTNFLMGLLKRFAAGGDLELFDHALCALVAANPQAPASADQCEESE